MAHKRPAAPRCTRGRWRPQPNKASASHPFAAATGAQETVAVSQELAPAVHGDARRWPLGVQTSNSLDPTGRDERCNFGRWIGDEQGGLRLQEPEPFPRRSESIVNRSYAEGLFCSFEQFGIRDGLSATEQPCCSGRSLDLRYEYRTVGGRLSSRKDRRPLLRWQVRNRPGARQKNSPAELDDVGDEVFNPRPIKAAGHFAQH